MTSVTVSVNRKNYTLQCDEGQERRLTGLAKGLDERLAEGRQSLSAASGMPVAEHYLWMLTAMTLMEEAAAAQDEIAHLREELERGAPPGLPEALGEQQTRMELVMVETLDSISDRVERISSTL